jgi:hypothetical protein
MVAQGIYWGTRPVERIEQELARYRAVSPARKPAKSVPQQAQTVSDSDQPVP